MSLTGQDPSTGNALQAWMAPYLAQQNAQYGTQNQAAVANAGIADPSTLGLGSTQPADLSSLVGATTPANAGGTLEQVAGNTAGDVINGSGNENQQQIGQQTGNYSTAENNLAQSLGLSEQQMQSIMQQFQNVQGTTSGTTNQATSGNTSGTQATQGTSTTGQSTSGTTTSTPNDTLGLGALLQQGGQGALQATNTSQNFLENALTQGNPALQQQVGQATSAALSGPGMVGTGNGAQARAAGNAASQVGINDFGQQISAAGALGGPTALSNLVGAGTPYIGNTQSTLGNLAAVTGNNQVTGSNTSNNQNTTGSNTGASNQTTTGDTTNSGTTTGATSNTQASTGTTAGTAAGSSASIGEGEVPQSSSSGGGSYVCTAMVHFGLLKKNSVKAAVEYALRTSNRLLLVGYAAYGPWLAKLCLTSPLLRRLLLPICRAILCDELRLARGWGRRKWTWWAPHLLFRVSTIACGFVAQTRFKADTRDPQIKLLLQNEGLFFSTNGK